MKRVSQRLLICLLITSFSSAVFADDIKIEVDEKTCQKVQRHLARQDVAYKPGVSARGKAVVPADVSNSQLKLPERIVLDISLPIQDLFAITNPPQRSLQNAEVQVGKLEYDIASGALQFNGQKMGEAALVTIGKKCYEVYEVAD